MKLLNIKKILLIFILLFTKIHSHPFITLEKDLVQEKTQDLSIKVLLNKVNSKSKIIFNIKSKNNLYIKTDDNINKKILISEPHMELMVKDNQIFIAAKNHTNNKIKSKKIETNKIEISTLDGNIELNGTEYLGNLTFIIDTQDRDKSLLIINKLSLEDYVGSVLASEIIPTWTGDILKVQAVVSRTYAYYLMLQNNSLYHIKNTNFHQKYDGHHNYTELKKAVAKTKGEIITYKNKPILAMFDACCGGINTSKMSTLDYRQAPYLSRKSVCNYCSKYYLYSWQVNFNVEHFLSRLKKNIDLAKKLVGAKKFLGVKITKQDKAGIVKRVKLIFSNKEITLNATQFWENLKDKVISLNFTIKYDNVKNKIIINGHGYGHQTGLCQRGAFELSNRGWDYKSIIKFYYPGVNFAVLDYAKA